MFIVQATEQRWCKKSYMTLDTATGTLEVCEILKKKKTFFEKKIFFLTKIYFFWNFIGISLTVIDWKTINQQKSSFLARKYLHFWRENIFVFGAKISSFLARKYLRFWRENIFNFGAKISSFLARKYLRRQQSESKNFFKTFFYSGNPTA